MSVQSYQDLTAWQRAMDLVKAVYRATQSWPHEELYGLTNQARRARCRPISRKGKDALARRSFCIT
jgi:four helix bundle protein